MQGRLIMKKIIILLFFLCSIPAQGKNIYDVIIEQLISDLNQGTVNPNNLSPAMRLFYLEYSKKTTYPQKNEILRQMSNPLANVPLLNAIHTLITTQVNILTKSPQLVNAYFSANQQEIELQYEYFSNQYKKSEKTALTAYYTTDNPSSIILTIKLIGENIDNRWDDIKCLIKSVQDMSAKVHVAYPTETVQYVSSSNDKLTLQLHIDKNWITLHASQSLSLFISRIIAFRLTKAKAIITYLDNLYTYPPMFKFEVSPSCLIPLFIHQQYLSYKFSELANELHALSANNKNAEIIKLLQETTDYVNHPVAIYDTYNVFPYACELLLETTEAEGKMEEEAITLTEALINLWINKSEHVWKKENTLEKQAIKLYMDKLIDNINASIKTYPTSKATQELKAILNKLNNFTIHERFLI